MRGLACLEEQGEIGRASGNTVYSVWTHTYLLELAAALLADPAVELPAHGLQQPGGMLIALQLDQLEIE